MTSSFERIWNEKPSVLDPNTALAHRAPCLPAVMFQAWIDALFERQLDNATLPALNQLKVLVQDRYFLFRRRLPSEHSHEDGKRPDHRCVYAVYEASIDLLHRHEIMLAPPPLEITKGRTRKPRTGLGGILLGKIVPESDS